MSRASWSKLGGGRLRRDCPELELARELWDCGAAGFMPQEKGRQHIEGRPTGLLAAAQAFRSQLPQDG